MNMTDLRLMIDAVNPSIGFTMLPTLADGSGWILGAFTDCENVVHIKYNFVANPPESNFHYVLESRNENWIMDDMKAVAEKVVELLTTRTLS